MNSIQLLWCVIVTLFFRASLSEQSFFVKYSDQPINGDTFRVVNLDSFIELSEGNFFTSAYYENGDQKMLQFSKISSFGFPIWSSTWNGGYNLTETIDSITIDTCIEFTGDVICGGKSYFNSTDSKMFLFRIAGSDGKIVWKKYLQTDDETFGNINLLKKLSTGGFIAVGTSNGFNSKESNSANVFFKFANDSETISWMKTIERKDANSTKITAIEESSSGSILFAGSHSDWSSGVNRFVFGEISDLGNVTFIKSFGRKEEEFIEVKNIHEIEDSYVLFSAFGYNSSLYYHFSKWNKAGSHLFDTRIAHIPDSLELNGLEAKENAFLKDSVRVNDGFLVVGKYEEAKSNTSKIDNGLLTKIDFEGNLIFSKQFKFNNNERRILSIGVYNSTELTDNHELILISEEKNETTGKESVNAIKLYSNLGFCGDKESEHQFLNFSGRISSTSESIVGSIENNEFENFEIRDEGNSSFVFSWIDRQDFFLIEPYNIEYPSCSETRTEIITNSTETEIGTNETIGTNNSTEIINNSTEIINNSTEIINNSTEIINNSTEIINNSTEPEIGTNETIGTNNSSLNCLEKEKKLGTSDSIEMYTNTFSYDSINQLVLYRLEYDNFELNQIIIKLEGNDIENNDLCYFTIEGYNQGEKPEWNKTYDPNCSTTSISMTTKLDNFLNCSGIEVLQLETSRIISTSFVTLFEGEKIIQNGFTNISIPYRQEERSQKMIWEVKSTTETDNFHLEVSETIDYLFHLLMERKIIEEEVLGSTEYKIVVQYVIAYPVGGIHEFTEISIDKNKTTVIEIENNNGISSADLEFVAKIKQGSFYQHIFNITIDVDGCAGFEKTGFAFTFQYENHIEGTTKDIDVNFDLGMNEKCSNIHQFGLIATVDDVRDTIPDDNQVRLNIPMKLKTNFISELNFEEIDLRKVIITTTSGEIIRTIWNNSVITLEGQKMEMEVTNYTIDGKTGIIEFQFIIGGDNEYANDQEAKDFYQLLNSINGLIHIKQYYDVKYLNLPFRRTIEADDTFYLRKGIRIDSNELETLLDEQFQSSATQASILNVFCFVIIILFLSTQTLN